MQQPKPEKKSKAFLDARRRDLAKIHIAKKQLGLDDSTYREMLQNITGVKSAADLDESGRAKLLAHLKARGFRPVHKSAKKSGMHKPPAKDREPLISKVNAILTDLNLPWSYADGIAKRMFQIDRVRWLDPHQLQKLTVALIYHQKKVYSKLE